MATNLSSPYIDHYLYIINSWYINDDRGRTQIKILSDWKQTVELCNVREERKNKIAKSLAEMAK